MMRMIATFALVAACGATDDGPRTETHPFGPYEVGPRQEKSTLCVQISLHNADYANLNTVELTTGPGFHHSNWFWVPEHVFPGEDGTYECNDRGFDQAIAGIFGGVIFAQSTQTPHETQKFPDGVIVRIPPKSKLVTTIHLLNPTDEVIDLNPNIKLTFLPEAMVTTRLAGVNFQNQALALPPNMQSKFTIECDIQKLHNDNIHRDPDFKIYYALGHYHELGTGITLDAVRPDGSSANIYTTTTKVGDTLGGQVNPVFDMTGFTKFRFSCEYYNPRASTVRWGNGDQEMCVFLAFSDSQYNFAGGVIERTEPENPVMVGNTMTFQNGCVMFAGDADRG